MKVEWRSIMSVFWGNVGGWWRVEKSADCGKRKGNRNRYRNRHRRRQIEELPR